PGKGSDESRISFQFDELRFGNRTVPVTVNLRALASLIEVHAAQIPTAGGDGVSEADWSLLKIGGDQIHIDPKTGSECGGGKINNAAQEFWLFSPDACGTYGFWRPTNQPFRTHRSAWRSHFDLQRQSCEG